MVYNLLIAGVGNISIQDGTLDTTDTSLALPGRNTANYGLSLNQNLINLLQNFSSINSPPNPVSGQLWYDSNTLGLNYYTGSNWTPVTPPFNNDAGSVGVELGSDFVTMILSNQTIVAIVSEVNINPSYLPTDIVIFGVSYSLGARFPQGITAGITLATENGNALVFTGVATQAQSLLNTVNVTLAGSTVGTATFNGSSDVIINTSGSNINVAGTYNQVTVDQSGRVISGNVNLGNVDITMALGYTPIGSIEAVGDISSVNLLTGSALSMNVTISNSTVTPGTYSQVTVDQRGIVTAGAVGYELPLFGIIMYPNTYAIPNNYSVCNGQVVNTGTVTFNTPNLVADQIGPTVFIMRNS